MAKQANGNKRGIAIIIPSLRPDNRFLELLARIWERANSADMHKDILGIVVINDGSASEYSHFFEEAKAAYNCTVLHHMANLGKGRALKTAFNHCMMTWPDMIGVVTMDADGQHDADDMLACMRELKNSPEKLILGCRNFDDPAVPFKSKHGNKITRQVFRFLCGVKVGDTQTGLRAIPAGFMNRLMNVPGERFEYEMNMLIECPEAGVFISEVPIQTIYLDDNVSSHFNPLLDAARVYAVFLKFLFAGLSSVAIDILLFAAFVNLFRGLLPEHYILAATACARVVSSLYNFIFNRNVVFKGVSGIRPFIKYYILVVVQIFVSAFTVQFLYALLPFNEIVVKLLVDTVIALVNFQVQRAWVFKRPSATTQEDA